jgi:hypothetical protein
MPHRLQGLQGDMVLVEGVEYGKARLTVSLKDPAYQACMHCHLLVNPFY